MAHGDELVAPEDRPRPGAVGTDGAAAIDDIVLIEHGGDATFGAENARAIFEAAAVDAVALAVAGLDYLVLGA